MSTDRNRSILLQVAFKAAVDLGTGDSSDLQSKTSELFDALISLHEKYGISLEDTSRGSGRSGRSGSYGGGKSSSGSTARTTDSIGIAFEVDGVTWFDYRAAKVDGTVKPNFPDFKSGQNSVWMQDRDGNDVPEAVKLAEIADLAAAFV